MAWRALTRVASSSEKTPDPLNHALTAGICPLFLPPEPLFGTQFVHEPIDRRRDEEIVVAMKLGRGGALRAAKGDRVAGLVVYHVVPVAAGHKQCLSRLENRPVALSLPEPRKAVEVGLVHVNIATAGERVSIEIACLIVREECDSFPADNGGVEDVGHVDVEMHLSDGASAAEEHKYEVF